MTKSQAKESILRLLQVTTIDGFQDEADQLCEEQDLPTLEAFRQDGSPVIITKTRRQVLNGITQQLADEEASGVVLSGAYGSGKTLLRYAIQSLCEGPATFDGEDFEQNEDAHPEYPVRDLDDYHRGRYEAFTAMRGVLSRWLDAIRKEHRT